VRGVLNKEEMMRLNKLGSRETFHVPLKMWEAVLAESTRQNISTLGGKRWR